MKLRLNARSWLESIIGSGKCHPAAKRADTCTRDVVMLLIVWCDEGVMMVMLIRLM
jgi:hypothetical protein